MFTKFGKKKKTTKKNPTNLRSWVNLNQGKPKEIHAKLIKILKTKDKAGKKKHQYRKDTLYGRNN